MAQWFRFYPLRFEFLARESLHFPSGKAANILRGALGTIFKKIACTPDCRNPRVCAARESCLYARVFEPAASCPGPSGFADWPRPFVFRARHLDGATIQPGRPFHFDLHVFTLAPEVLAAFVDAFAALAREGLGPRRGRAALQRVRRIALGDIPECDFSIHEPVEPVSLDLDPLTQAPDRVRVEFLSPTELKHQQQIAARPEFPILFGHIRDRLSTLSRLYGPGSLPIDFQATGLRAQAVRMTNCRVRRLEFQRLSTRTGQTHSIGGFVGFAEYEGEMAEFLPYLQAARWIGVGRHAVWGKGEISCISPPLP